MGNNDAEFVASNEDDGDDEETLAEQETCEGGHVDHQEEIENLEKEGACCLIYS